MKDTTRIRGRITGTRTRVRPNFDDTKNLVNIRRHRFRHVTRKVTANEFGPAINDDRYSPPTTRLLMLTKSPLNTFRRDELPSFRINTIDIAKRVRPLRVTTTSNIDTITFRYAGRRVRLTCRRTLLRSKIKGINGKSVNRAKRLISGQLLPITGTF